MNPTDVCLLSGTAHPALGESLSQVLGVPLAKRILDRFPDGELRVHLEEDVRGRDVFLLQSVCAPVGDHVLELLLLADACRRSGAARITAVLPYFAYARQDRREGSGDPLGAAVLARTLGEAVDRIVTVDLHSPAIEGSFPVPMEHVSAMPLLQQHLGTAGGQRVVVSPDVGGLKRAERFARELGAPVAVVHKSRLSGAEVKAGGLVGDVQGASPIIVDDMISTAGTIEAAVHVLLDQGCAPHITVCATHGLFVGPARDRLAKLPLERVVITDSLPPPADLPVPLETASIAPLLADTVRRLHADGAA